MVFVAISVFLLGAEAAPTKAARAETETTTGESAAASASFFATTTPEVCTYDYSIVQRAGSTTFDGLPIKILRQAGDTEGTVDFIVGNTWKTTSGSDVLGGLHVVSNDQSDGSKSCYASSDVPARKSVDSSLRAYCTDAGNAFVKLYAADESFDPGSDNARVPIECAGISDADPPGAVEYIAVLECTPTCQENTLPDTDPFEIDPSGPSPTSSPTAVPTGGPTTVPTTVPTGGPTGTPTNNAVPTDAPTGVPTAAPVVSPDGDVVSLTCPQADDDEPLLVGDWEDGSIAELGVFAGKDVLCTLVEMNVSDDGATTVLSDLKPVGRSYNGNDWEVAPGDFATSNFDCSSGKCRIALPAPKEGKQYVLKSYDYSHDLTSDDLKARFLERATFGPTKADIAAFTSPRAWVDQQFAMTRTSHRRFFRERATDWFSYTGRSGLVHTGPCTSGSRYRNFALTRNDYGSYLEIRKSPLDDNKLILSIGGQIRTVVDGPMQYGKFRKGVIDGELTKINLNLKGKSFKIEKLRPTEGVRGRFELSIPQENGKKPIISDIFFNEVSGNPRVQFDDAHVDLLLENLVELPKSKYEEVMTQYFFEGNTEVLQLNSNVKSTTCDALETEVVGFTYPKKSVIARTSNGETRYWIHSPTFDLLGNDLDAPLADGGKKGVDLTKNPPSDLDETIQAVLQVKCSNVPRTFLNEDSCRLTDQDACSYDEYADIDESADGKILVCGSPDEVANDHGIASGPRGKGGFNLETRVNTTESGPKQREQRLNVWAEIALNADDQLAQRMAYALSQILVIADDVGSKDGTENFLSYYDIFVRNAYGNYFDVLKEVTRHPMMARMLTFVNGQSTGYAYIKEKYIQQADENYAREVMQLFSIGLALQNDDGTLKLDDDGNEIATYTNFDISEYAKVYVGLRDQLRRGNIETRINEIDPLRIETSWKDKFPKLGLNSQFIGDGYPLCSDLPVQHFLKKGATYRILGAKANPDFAPENWAKDTTPKRASLDFESSNLASILCNTNESGECNPKNVVVLPADVQCYGIECQIREPRTIEVAKGLWYEYIRPPCVNQAFYNDGKSMYKAAIELDTFKQIQCGNPSLLDGSTVCCEVVKDKVRIVGRKEFFGSERTSFENAIERCSEDGYEMCGEVPRNAWPDCKAEQAACDPYNVFYWLSAPCSMRAKVSPEGNVAIVHIPSAATGDKEGATYSHVSTDNKSFFRTDWRASNSFPDIGSFLDDFDNKCESIQGCFVDVTDGNCQCEVTVEDSVAFAEDSELISVDNLLSTATIGSFSSDDASFVSTGIDGVKKHPAGQLSLDTIFQVTDSIGRTHYRKNLLSIAKLGDGSLVMRNPVTFWSLPDATSRDGEYELDAALEHYFFHPNVPSFLALRLAQRFGTSNPSPRYIKVIATAFKTGNYEGFGSNEYGCLKATVAAIILDREAQDHILDTDPIQGQLQGPYLRVMKAMRASEYTSDPDNPMVRFFGDIVDSIGEEPHKIPSVFSFFGPNYVAPGRARSANMIAPEAQVLNGPSSISTVNGLMSLFKYGSSRCGDSFFRTTATTTTGSFNVCVIGDDTTNFGNNKYDPAVYGLNAESADDVVDDLATLLTSGRLSFENRQIIKDAFIETLSDGTTQDRVHEALVNAQLLVALSPEFHSNSLVRKKSKRREETEEQQSTGTSYKAVVHFMLSGGLDSFNVLVPDVCSGTNEDGTTVDVQYLQERGSLAFDRSKGEFDLTIPPNSEQPCERFAIHEELPYIKELYDDEDLLFFANVGVVNANNMNRDNWDVKTKSRLFGHEAMRKETKKIDPFNDLAGSGVLGRMDDILLTKYNSVVNAIGIIENSVALAGNPTIPVRTSIVGRDGPIEFGKVQKDEVWFDVENKAADINSEQDAFSGIFGDTWSDVLMNGVFDGDRLSEYIANEEHVGLDETIWAPVADEDKISRSFQTLAKLIQTRNDRKVDRDTFTIEFGGFDHHQTMKPLLKEKLVEVNRNIKRFVEQLKKDGVWDQVTIVVASEFGRTISPNSNAGADHGWGGNYMVMGGSLDGGRVLGKYPDDLTNESRLNASRNTRTRFIPTMSWEHIYNGIAEWMADGFGDELTEEDLDYILPNRQNCIDPVEGEGSVPLFTKGDLYA